MEPHPEEQRREERVPTALPVKLGGEGSGIARDVSPSGLYLEMEASTEPGARITFEIDFDTPGGTLLLSCVGEVVRVDRRGGRIGVGVRILESRLQPGLASRAPR